MTAGSDVNTDHFPLPKNRTSMRLPGLSRKGLARIFPPLLPPLFFGNRRLPKDRVVTIHNAQFVSVWVKTSLQNLFSIGPKSGWPRPSNFVPHQQAFANQRLKHGRDGPCLVDGQLLCTLIDRNSSFPRC